MTGLPGAINPAMGTGSSVLETLVVQNCAMMQQFWAQQQGLAAGMADGLGEPGAGAGSRGSTAWDRQRRLLAEQPSKITEIVRSRMLQALNRGPAEMGDAGEYLRRHGAFSGKQDLGYMMSMVAEAFDLMERGDIESAHARLTRRRPATAGSSPS